MVGILNLRIAGDEFQNHFQVIIQDISNDQAQFGRPARR
jgi:hypothetical protein